MSNLTAAVDAFNGATFDVMTRSYATASGWGLENLLTNATAKVKLWVGLFFGLVGIIAIAWGVYKFFTKLFGGPSGQQTSWLTIAVLIIAGAVVAFGGTTLVFDIAQGGKQTIEDLGNGMIVPFTMWL